VGGRLALRRLSHLLLACGGDFGWRCRLWLGWNCAAAGNSGPPGQSVGGWSPQEPVALCLPPHEPLRARASLDSYFRSLGVAFVGFPFFAPACADGFSSSARDSARYAAAARADSARLAHESCGPVFQKKSDGTRFWAAGRGKSESPVRWFARPLSHRAPLSMTTRKKRAARSFRAAGQP
jgi:hypothetical protein